METDYKIVQLASIISAFNPNWDEDVDPDERFLEAVEMAEIIFENTMKSTISKVNAMEEVEKSIQASKDGVMVLEKYMPWKEILLNSENSKAELINFVVFPSNRGGYNVYTVPEKMGSFESRKLFPKEWAGLKDKELQKVTTVQTARFCHNKCFICAVETKEDAIKLANIANR